MTLKGDDRLIPVCRVFCIWGNPLPRAGRAQATIGRAGVKPEVLNLKPVHCGASALGVLTGSHSANRWVQTVTTCLILTAALGHEVMPLPFHRGGPRVRGQWVWTHLGPEALS